MRRLFEYMPLRGCALCERIMWKTPWLCGECRRQLHFLVAPPRKSNSSSLQFPHFYLWDSRPENEVLLREFVSGLKGGAPEAALSEWIELLVCRQRSSKIRADYSRAVIVPAPPSRPGCRDHAVALADVLAKNTGASQLMLLKRPERFVEQKFQNRQARTRIKLEALPSAALKKLLADMEIHFVDDVVTTGSTAKAAWRALGRPERFYVWSLIYRSHLRERA